MTHERRKKLKTKELKSEIFWENTVQRTVKKNSTQERSLKRFHMQKRVTKKLLMLQKRVVQVGKFQKGILL